MYCISPALSAATASGEPSKPPTLTLAELTGLLLSAAIAPSAISSLPLITPMMSGWACSIACILLKPRVRSQLATSRGDLPRGRDAGVSTVSQPFERVAALLSAGLPSSST